MFHKSNKSTKHRNKARHHNLLSHADPKKSITCNILPTITMVTIVAAVQAVEAVVAAMAVVEARKQ